jgi:DNA-binding response OmpR family regulator
MSRRVLIVDDSLTVRMDLHEAFSADGYDTLLCATGEQARAAFAAEAFDVAVLDVLLPDADGVDLLGELRARPERRDTVAVLLSTEAEVQDRVRGLHTGADEYVGKPYDVAYLLARVRQLVGERTPDATGRTTVLVIDDSATFRNLLGEELQREGYAVLTAETGEEGLRVAADRRPAALLVDGVLPGIDGATVIRRIRLDAALRDTPCLLLTAADDYATEPQMLEAGADAFARKAQDLAVVKAKLAAILRQTADTLPFEGTGSLHGPRKVLAVDTDPRRLRTLTEHARDEGYDVVSAGSEEDALALLAAQAVDCVVLGADDPDALVTCRRLKAAPEIAEIPLVMTGGPDDGLLPCLNAGADDYVRGADAPDTLRAHVRAQIRRKQQQDESRRIREELIRRELAAAEERAARQLAETRAALVEELEWRNRELEAFSGSVSHDLRGPLQIISGFAEELLDPDSTLDPVARNYAERILNAAMRMGDLVEALLRLAQASRGDLRRDRFDLSETAAQVLKEVAGRNPGREVDCAVQPHMIAYGDESLVRVVLENIVNNAFKFTSKVDAPRIEIGWERGDEPRYFVRDNGAGFPAGKSEELFRPFARLHNAAEFPGHGIGLTTVHRIVDRHGGRIWAHGEPGNGATFRFTLPTPELAEPENPA